MPPFPKPRFDYSYDLVHEVAALRDYRRHKPGRQIPAKGKGRLLVATLSDVADHTVVIDLQTGTLRPLHGLAHGDRPVVVSGIAVTGLELKPDELAVAQRAGDPHAIRPSAAGEVLP